jgi:pyruvate/2-oxoglutarate dehydrogenase complex dihydrolipoamide acyltransferase (E2) component
VVKVGDVLARLGEAEQEPFHGQGYDANADSSSSRFRTIMPRMRGDDALVHLGPFVEDLEGTEKAADPAAKKETNQLSTLRLDVQPVASRPLLQSKNVERQTRVVAAPSGMTSLPLATAPHQQGTPQQPITAMIDLSIGSVTHAPSPLPPPNTPRRWRMRQLEDEDSDPLDLWLLDGRD